MRSDPDTLLKVLGLIEPKIQSMRTEQVLCELAESLAVIRQIMAKEFMAPHNDGNSTLRVTGDRRLDSNTTKVQLNDTVTSTNANTTEPSNNFTASPYDYEILNQTSARMLTTVANVAAERVTNLQAESLCRLLVVYSLLPFQADSLIDACEQEVAKRQALLESAASTASVEDLLRQAAETSVAATKTVFGKDEDDHSSPFGALKKGLKSLFSSENEEGEISEEMQKFRNEIGELLNRVTDSVTEVDQCMEQIGTASNVHTDTALQRITEGANFELGRCRELIENYRRIDHRTGKRRSQYDYRHSRDLGKRLLSRLIPR